MDSRLYRKLRGKKGTTLVEVIAAVLILAIVVTAVLTGIGFSQRTVLAQGSQSDAAAKAQNLADQLIAKLHGSSVTDFNNLVSDAIYVNTSVATPTFPDLTLTGSNCDRQYTITPVKGDPNLSSDSTKLTGYRIKVAVAYRDSGGRKFVQLTAFAAKDGDKP